MICLLAACAPTPPVEVIEPSPEVPYYPVVEDWLQLQREVQGLTREEAVEALVDVGRPDSSDRLFYYALLNQQLGTLGGWAQARDTLQALETDETLTESQRQLASLLREYNQAQINWHARNRELSTENDRLRAAVAEAREKSDVLERRIQALTELEADMSTRRGE